MQQTRTFLLLEARKGMVIISDDFDEPLEDFKEYM